MPKTLPSGGAVDRSGFVDLRGDTFQRGVDQEDGERQGTPDIRYGQREQRGLRIAGPIYRRLDDAESKQDAVQKAEIEAVKKCPDLSVGDRRYRIGQQDQHPRRPPRPDRPLTDQQGDRHREDDLGAH